MNSKERLQKALNHQQPDKVPIDLGSNAVTGVHVRIVIPEKYQSTVSGIMIMAGFLIGSLSPIIMGYLKPILGLSFGISMLSVVWLLCGILLLVAYKYYFKKDYARVHDFKKVK